MTAAEFSRECTWESCESVHSSCCVPAHSIVPCAILLVNLRVESSKQTSVQYSTSWHKKRKPNQTNTPAKQQNKEPAEQPTFLSPSHRYFPRPPAHSKQHHHHHHQEAHQQLSSGRMIHKQHTPTMFNARHQWDDNKEASEQMTNTHTHAQARLKRWQVVFLHIVP